MSARALRLDARLLGYLAAHGARETAVQKALRRVTQRLPQAQMQIGAEQGALMQLLVRLLGARRCLEIGTFTGASALAVALALPPGGRIVCCDLSQTWTAVARRYWRKARVAGKIDLRLAPALTTLDALLADGQAGRFDFAFIDADKANYLRYYERCLKLVRRGGLIAADNTLALSGAPIIELDSIHARAMVAFNELARKDERVEQAMLTVGEGLTLLRVR